jgi:alginate O-acetyltransferase complex protein AlgI
MRFTQFEFLIFLALVVMVYWRLGSRRRQNLLLVVASGLFYGWVHPWYLGLLIYSTVLDFGCGLAMARWPAQRRRYLVASVAGNLCLLAAFKYWGFFVESFAAAVGALGLPLHTGTLTVLLPVGISFFTFQTMSYTIDVYRGKVEPRRSLLDYATFVWLFPQLVAGPIERARNLLPQIEAERRFSMERLSSGFGLALWGAVKKMVVADTLALYVDAVFVLEKPSAVLVGAATLGFAVQILADFSGYTDIARGCARMLGFELMENFRSPYLATNPSDLWKRWHISLSSWIHEYLYVPLGGSRKGWRRRVVATFLAMGLSGLWHGAAWHFVVWGLYHGVLLEVYRTVGPPVQRLVPAGVGRRMAAIVLMFTLTCLGWLVFRAPSMLWLGGLQPTLDFSAWAASLILLTMSGLGGMVLWAGGMARTRVANLGNHPWQPLIRNTGWAICALAIFVLSRDVQNDFIYFRF